MHIPAQTYFAGIRGVSIGYDEAGEFNPATFGPGTATSGITATTVFAGEQPVRHVTVTKDDVGVTLEADNGLIRWDEDTEQWRWKDGRTSANDWPIGSVICQYAHRDLSDEEEAQLCAEADSWIKKGWLVELDEATHECIAAFIPQLTKSQPHKASTPVRLCLDYHGLNNLIQSRPGEDVPACAEKTL